MIRTKPHPAVVGTSAELGRGVVVAQPIAEQSDRWTNARTGRAARTAQWNGGFASSLLCALLATCLAWPPHVYAQVAPATLSGVVRDESGGAVADVAVVATAVDGTPVSVQTGIDGTFVINGLAAGRYTVVAQRDGFVPAVIPELVFSPGSARTITLVLRIAGISENVSVGAEQATPQAAPSTIAVAPTAVQSVAGAGENIYRVLQTLPGVAAVNDFDSRLTVRGGGPDQNLTMMDGVEIHNPYRLFGLTSAFNPETVERFELITGGFNAKYGDRLSSILVVENRAGRTATRAGATAAMSLTDGNLIAEGRLPGMNGSSWLVTGRRTYYDLIAERVVDGDLPSFGDVQARVDLPVRPGRTLTLFGLSSREGTDATFEDDADDESIDLLSSTLNDLGAAAFSANFGKRAFSKTTVSWYRNRESTDFAGDFRTGSRRSNRPGLDAEPPVQVGLTRAVVVRDLAARQELSVNAGKTHVFETGLEFHALDTNWHWRVTGERDFDAPNGAAGQGGTGIPSLLDSARASQRAGAWLTDLWTFRPRLRFERGLRVDWSGMTQEVILSPRLAIVADLTERTRLRFGGGRFTQSPGYEKLLQSDYFVDLSDTTELNLKSERAWHALASVERRMAPGVTMRAEGYYKRFDRMVLGRLETPDEVAARVGTYDFPGELAFGIPRAPEVTSNPANIGSGRAYGVELFASREATSASSRLKGWASYTWGRAETTAYGRTFDADYDRRHALSVVGAYRVSRLIELATTFRAQSGFPYTPAIGLRPATTEVPASDGSASPRLVPLRDAQGLLVWTTDYGDTSNLNSGRLPFFARLDMRVTFRPRWANDRWQIYVEAINVLNRDNASDLAAELVYAPDADRPRLTTTRSARLPLLPSFGLRYRF